MTDHGQAYIFIAKSFWSSAGYSLLVQHVFEQARVVVDGLVRIVARVFDPDALRTIDIFICAIFRSPFLVIHNLSGSSAGKRQEQVAA